MSYKMELADEELDELDAILRRELRESRGELRHTWDANYKDRVRHHIEMVEHMIQTAETVRTSKTSQTEANRIAG